MDKRDSNDVTLILQAVKAGEDEAEQRLFDLVYRELHRMARDRMRRETPGGTLRTTELVHEAYLRLFKEQPADWENRRHFFGAASRAMRQILVDRARKRQAMKHGGAHRMVTLDCDVPDEEDPLVLIALDEALTRLAEERPRHAEVVKYRYFLGLTVDETAELLRVSPRTVDSDWRLAKSWLRREIDRVDPRSG